MGEKDLRINGRYEIMGKVVDDVDGGKRNEEFGTIRNGWHLHDGETQHGSWPPLFVRCTVL